MSNEKVYVPPIKIQGIKTKLVPYIRSCTDIAPETVWVEPFLGSGVVGFNIAGEKAVFADTNPYLIDFYRQIQSGKITPQIVREYLEEHGKLLSERDEEYYYEVRARFNTGHDPLDFLFINRSCFNGMIRFNRNGQFNVPYGHKPERFAKAYITKIVNQVDHVSKLFQEHDWQFICQDFEETILSSPQGALIYCDPPYIGRHVDYYDSWDEMKEKRLCDALQRSGNRFILSTWDHNQYRENGFLESIWGFCTKVNIEHFYHVGAKEKNRTAMLEALMMNYVPQLLHHADTGNGGRKWQSTPGTNAN